LHRWILAIVPYFVAGLSCFEMRIRLYIDFNSPDIDESQPPNSSRCLYICIRGARFLVLIPSTRGCPGSYDQGRRTWRAAKRGTAGETILRGILEVNIKRMNTQVLLGRRRATTRQRLIGFTLLELLVVVVIIGLLAGLVAPRYFDTLEKSKTKIARAQLDAFEKALEQYRLDVGALPTNEQGLNALMTAPPGAVSWQGPYLKKDIPLDPWGRAYVYKLSPSGRDADVISYGADGQPGGSSEASDISLLTAK
jgi:general secretion pathway protein G